MMERGYRFRLYPSKEQVLLISKTFGCCRYVHNYYLQKRREAYERGEKRPSEFEQSRELTVLRSGLDWMQEVDSTALRFELKHLDRAYRNFFCALKAWGKKKAAGKLREGEPPPGPPQFKRKHEHNKSYRTKSMPGSIVIKDDHIKLPKLGWVRCVEHKPVEGRIISATVSQVSSGRYFVSVGVTEAPEKVWRNTGRHIDINIKADGTASTSTGEIIGGWRFKEKAEEKLEYLQRSLGRKKLGGRNWTKARIKLAKAHEKVANQRKYALHLLSSNLVGKYDSISVRSIDLDVPRDNEIERDAAWYEFKRQLAYKGKWHGKHVDILGGVEAEAATGETYVSEPSGDTGLGTSEVSVGEMVAESVPEYESSDPGMAAEPVAGSGDLEAELALKQ